MSLALDQDQRRLHKIRNLSQSVTMIAGIGLLMGVCAYLIWGPAGILWALIGAPAILLLGPGTSPELVMRRYRAAPLQRSDGEGIHAIVEILAERARLPAMPRLYLIPSSGLNAIAVGRSDQACIAITRGMLEKLNIRELAGVLAHEMSHIRNNDLWIMGFADSMDRLTRALSLAGIFLVLLNVPAAMTGTAVAPWALAALLYLAPLIGGLLRLVLGRAREFEADLEGARLTGDPAALTSALWKLERLRSGNWEAPPNRRRALPRLLWLCSHPPTKVRVRRLLELPQSDDCRSWIPIPAALKRIPDLSLAPQPEPCFRESGL